MKSNVVFVTIASILVQIVGRRVVPPLDGRIVGGEDADIEDYPYQISLENSQFLGHICGGSILNKVTILTATHCTLISNVESLSIRAGSSIRESGGKVIKVAEVFEHPLYDGWKKDYDAAVLRLVEDLTFGTGINAISLQPPGVDPDDGSSAVVTGWGVQSGGVEPDQLQMVSVRKINVNECREAYSEYEVTERMICYADEGKDSCQGDSGGPLVSDGNQVGIVSWGLGCADPYYPGVYAKVSDSEIHKFIVDFLK